MHFPDGWENENKNVENVEVKGKEKGKCRVPLTDNSSIFGGEERREGEATLTSGRKEKGGVRGRRGDQIKIAREKSIFFQIKTSRFLA